jgi:hypothetical protein
MGWKTTKKQMDLSFGCVVILSKITKMDQRPAKITYTNKSLTFQDTVKNASFENCQVTIMRDALECEFKTCSKVTIMGHVSGGSFAECGKVVIMKDAHTATFTTCSNISIMKDAIQLAFNACPNISVLGRVRNSTRDDIPYTQEEATTSGSNQVYGNVVQVNGSGNVIRGGRSVHGIRGTSISFGNVNVSRGNVVGGTQTMTGPGDKYMDNLYVPASLGFGRLEKRCDGHYYGQKNDGSWYIYRAEQGDASTPSSWELMMDIIHCQLCGSPADVQELYALHNGKKRTFCSKSCQLEYYNTKH